MKSRHQRELAQQVLSREVGYVRKPHANRLRVALIFPNTYFVGMSNLGFQTIYRLFNDQPDIVCERAFLPAKQELAALRDAGTRLVTLESQTPLSDFDVIAFSVSFEWDYTNVLTMLRLAGLPVRAADRDYTQPLVVIGGAVTFVNPEPLAPFADVIAAGEGEALVPALLDAFGTSSRSEQLRRLAQQRGYYVPSFYDVDYAGEARSRDSCRVTVRARRRSSRRPRSRPPRRLIPRPRASSRQTRNSDRVSWWKSCVDARTCAASAGRATTTCRCARFRPTASWTSHRRRVLIRRGRVWCRSPCAITRRSSASFAA
jgi:hypothetical protein